MNRLACAACLLSTLAAWTPPHAAASSRVPAEKSNQIEIRNFMFTPKTLTVPVGAKVVWINRDEEPHTVVSANGQFAPSKALDSNDSYVATFGKPGTYVYYCTVHPFMTGTIVVK
ncbi:MULTISPECIES: cupredoxin domain-containing protein [Rhodanobacter]|uniref:Cupredoxin family copper-binding protein n=1 Tax=Rhodanobacter hydrolyticus TaxID=2250595 RepID=A0ABW8JBX8_9GAMM|nr:cupredoxin family copper-binding protein [Rhodanobacter sp. 7MK24]MBD8880326.1 cupredoxin family copper-binding protein [Rhodanobacter sp. 7MK24]